MVGRVKLLGAPAMRTLTAPRASSVAAGVAFCGTSCLRSSVCWSFAYQRSSRKCRLFRQKASALSTVRHGDYTSGEVKCS